MLKTLFSLVPASAILLTLGECILPESIKTTPRIIDGDTSSSLIIDGDTPSVSIECGSVAASLKKYLLDVGYNESSAAAIMGNIKGESGYRTNLIEGGKTVDDSFVAFKNGNKTFKGGFGLVQWTSKGRVQRLQEYADSIGKSVVSTDAQFGFMVKELNEYKYGPSVLNSKSFEEATFLIYRYYETPLSSFCKTNDKNGCYNNRSPKSYSQLSATETSSAYKAFTARFKSAQAAKSIDISSCTTDKDDGVPSDIQTPTDPGGGDTYVTGAVGLKSANGFYSQNDYASITWRSDGSSIKDSGCSLIAVANALKALNRDVNPSEMGTWSRNQISGPNDTGWLKSVQIIGRHYGLKFDDGYLWETVSTSTSYKEKKVREVLSNGGFVIISGARKDVYPNLEKCSDAADMNAGRCVFSYNGHFAVLLGITADGKGIVANPAAAKNRLWTFPLEEILKVSNKAKAVR